MQGLQGVGVMLAQPLLHLAQRVAHAQTLETEIYNEEGDKFDVYLSASADIKVAISLARQIADALCSKPGKVTLSPTVVAASPEFRKSEFSSQHEFDA